MSAVYHCFTSILKYQASLSGTSSENTSSVKFWKWRPTRRRASFKYIKINKSTGKTIETNVTRRVHPIGRHKLTNRIRGYTLCDDTIGAPICFWQKMIDNMTMQLEQTSYH